MTRARRACRCAWPTDRVAWLATSGSAWLIAPYSTTRARRGVSRVTSKRKTRYQDAARLKQALSTAGVKDRVVRESRNHANVIYRRRKPVLDA
jgi:hypothetical protein